MFEFLKFSLISSIITLSAGLVMFYFTRYDFNFKELYNEGLDLFKRKEYKNALSKFNIAISKFPDKAQAYYNAGLCELKLKSYSKAKYYFLKALELQPDDVDTIYNLGYVELLLEEIDRAKNYFNSILEKCPQESDLLFNLGYIAQIENNISEAKSYIKQAIEISPEKKVYKKYYQDILEKEFEQSSDMSLVSEMLDLSLELLIVYPDDETVMYRTAVAYAQLGDWENSVNYCERLYNKNPNSHKACNQYGLALFCKGEMSEAIEMYENAIRLAPEVADTYINLMLAYDKNSDTESAKTLANEIIKRFPDNPVADMAKDYLEKNIDTCEKHQN